MFKVIKKSLKNLKNFFSNASKRISLLVSLVLLLTLSGALISLLFLSDLNLEKLEQSDYFKSKIQQVLEKNEIHPEGFLSINFDKFSIAEINIEKASHESFSEIVGYEINLKVDLLKYWLGFSFIDEVFIGKVQYRLPNNFNLNLEKAESLDLKQAINSFRNSLSKINSGSIYIKRCVLKLRNRTFDFNEIYISESAKLFHAKANLNLKQNAQKLTLISKVDFSIENADIIKFNLELQDYDFYDFLHFYNVPKKISSFLDTLFDNAALSDKKINDIRFVGTYNLNSNYLNFGLTNITGEIKLKSSLKLLELYKSRTLFFGKTELFFKDYSVLLSNIQFDIASREFEINGTKFSIAREGESILPSVSKVFGVFPFEGGIISKIKLQGEDPASLKASIDILEPKSRSVDAGAFELLLHVGEIEKINLDKVNPLLNSIFKGEKKEISLSNANAQISLNLKTNNIELNFQKGKIDKLVYIQNSKPFVELENIEFEGNLNQGYVAISSINKIEPSKTRYKDVTVEFSPTGSVELDREITLSFKSTINDLISLTPKKKNEPKWINYLTTSQRENEVSIIYSKAISLSKIDSFLTPEEDMFEVNIKNFPVPISDKNILNLVTLNLKGIGGTIFFEGMLSAEKRKIKGSVNNGLSSFSGEDSFKNLTISFEDLNSEMLFPYFSTFYVKGPIKLSFSLLERGDDTSVQSNIDLKNAAVYIPALALKKTEGKYGQLNLNFKNNNEFDFKYTQNKVFVSGSASHKSIIEISKINYSTINTPDIKIEGASFQKFGEYNQFKTNKGSVSLDFLMRLNIKKKDKPLDFIFNNILVTFKKNKFLGSVRGEIRSFEGLRGYAKGELSPNSNLDITISPGANSANNIVISGGDAGELLRRGKYYENGYGGVFKASILYKNKSKISGSLEIEDFRIRNAPVLAQLISSASIIGLLNNLNGTGLLFTKIEGAFDYKDGELVLENGVAVGPSLGLTMSGYERYGKKQNVVNVNGLISPVYIVNGVVKAIPLIGKVLGGEKGEGVFGVSYKVQGNSSNPRVSVNPLSILAPGVFRKIFSIKDNSNM